MSNNQPRMSLREYHFVFTLNTYRWLGVLLYLIFLFMVVVVMLNMLIASMTDTFANVQTDAQRDLALARAWIVARVEHNSMLTLVSI